MNKLQKIAVGICIMSIPLINSCKKDDPVSCDWATEVQQEANAASAALSAYTADPTNTVKCNEFKTAYQNYINALDDHKSCATAAGQEAEIQSAIDSLQTALNSIQC